MSDVALIGLVIVGAYVVLGYKRPLIAFTTVPIACLFLAWLAVETASPEIMLLAPTLFVVTLIAVAVDGVMQFRDSWQWYHRWSWRLLLALVAVLVLGVLLVGFEAIGAGYLLPVLLVLGAIAVMASLTHSGRSGRRIAALEVFGTIGTAIRQNLPLPMALECAAGGARYGVDSVLREIRTWLVKGHSLTEAVQRGYPNCPPRALAMLAVGERMHQLPAVVATIERDLTSDQSHRRQAHPLHPFYPLLVLAVMLLITFFVLTFVLPRLVDVVTEMTADAQLPTATRALVWLASGDLFWPVSSLFLAIVLSVWLWRRRVHHRGRGSGGLGIGDFLLWHLPLLRWFERNRSMVQSIEMLRISLEADRPVDEAIANAIELDVNRRFRRRLRCWLERVQRGENIADSARHCRLGTALAWAFESGAGNTPTVLDTLERHYRALYDYRANMVRYTSWPVGILLLGLSVGFIVYAFFSPAVALIDNLAYHIYP